MTGKNKKVIRMCSVSAMGLFSYIYTAIITCESVWVDVIEKTFGPCSG